MTGLYEIEAAPETEGTRPEIARWAARPWSLSAPARLARSSAEEWVREEVARHANALSLALLCRRPPDDPHALQGLASHPRLSRGQARQVARAALLYLAHPHRGQFGFAPARDALWSVCRRYGSPDFVLPSLLAGLDGKDTKVWPGAAGRTRQDCLVEVLLGLPECGAEEIRQVAERMRRRKEAMRLALHPDCPEDVIAELQKELEPRDVWKENRTERRRFLFYVASGPDLLALPWVRSGLFRQDSNSLMSRIFESAPPKERCEWVAELAVLQPGYVLRWLTERPEEFSPEERKRLLGVLLTSKEPNARLQAIRLSSHVLWARAV